jgi:dolichyl-phosphate-mannose--protein O-mannosyl transferase
VFVVRQAIFRSFPVYVNVVHLCVLVFVSLFNVEVWRLRVGGLCRESIVGYDVTDGVFFFFVFFIL